MQCGKQKLTFFPKPDWHTINTEKQKEGDSMDHFLAVDIGASSGRHILGSIENEKLVLEEI